MRVAAVIFVGGKATRLGGIDKGAIDVRGVSAFACVAGAMGAADAVFASVAPAYPGARYRGCPVIKDDPHLLGHEARDPGVILSALSALEFVKAQGFDAMVTAPVDTPFLPEDYSARLIKVCGSSTVVADNEGRVHGLHAAMSVGILKTMRRAIIGDGLRRVSKLHEVLGSETIAFPTEIMRNINTPEDLKFLS